MISQTLFFSSFVCICASSHRKAVYKSTVWLSNRRLLNPHFFRVMCSPRLPCGPSHGRCVNSLSRVSNELYPHTCSGAFLCFSWDWKASSVLITLLRLLQATCLATTPYWTRSLFSPLHQSEQYQDLPVSKVGLVPRDLRGSKAPLAGLVFLAPMARADDQETEVREGVDLLIFLTLCHCCLKIEKLNCRSGFPLHTPSSSFEYFKAKDNFKTSAQY